MSAIEILGGISAKTFIQEYWQKKPLLIRDAFPNFKNFLSKKELIHLSRLEEVLSRIVTKNNNQWELKDGPFKVSHFKKLSGRWTLLVQGINHFIPEAQNLLNQFNFIPYARLDDIMASYAVPNAGVGPHFDSYDVFLLQGYGERLWQISNQDEKKLDGRAPLKILKKFYSEEEWVLKPGDMLYLPPGYAHNGIALSECITYSIGFLASSYEEIAHEFLGYLQTTYRRDAMYEDPDLNVCHEPAYISKQMHQKISDIIKTIKIDEEIISSFLGKYLTQTKPNLYIDSPNGNLKKSDFKKLAYSNGLQLSLKVCMLYTDKAIYIDGEEYLHYHPELIALANNRGIAPKTKLDIKTLNLLYQWYRHGYITVNMS